MRYSHWPTSGCFGEEVAGAQHHTKAYEAITAWPFGAERSLFCIADLTPEPTNLHDPNAIAIICEGKKIGYISKNAISSVDNAAEIREILNKGTTANAKITRKIGSDGKAYYSSWLDIDFKRPPSKSIRGKSNRLVPILVPCLRDVAIVRDGHLVMVFTDTSKETSSICTPGTMVDCWSPEGSEDVFLYAQGSVGGSCRLGVTDLGFLRNAGFTNAEAFSPVIHSASGNTVIVCAAIPPKP